jgi:hypothetical protein
MQFRNYHFIILLLLTILSPYLLSCSKEYVDFPYNDIESFEIKDAKGNALTASIVNNEIILYWPPYQDEPTTLTPTITVSERANISPTSGTAITIDSGKPVEYKVTAQDGSAKSYKLKLIVNQPIISASPNVAESIYPIGQEGSTLTLRTQHIIPEESKTSVFLIDSSNKETRLSIIRLMQNGITVQMPATLERGHYQIKVISGQRSVTTNKFEVVAPPLYLVMDSAIPAQQAKRGDKITMSYHAEWFLKYYQETFGHFVIEDANQQKHPIQSGKFNPTSQKIELTIPTAVSIGSIRYLYALDKQNGEIQSFPLGQLTIVE